MKKISINFLTTLILLTWYSPAGLMAKPSIEISSHPYLFFSRADIPVLKHSAVTSHAEHFKMLVKWADQFTGFDPIPSATLPKNIDTMQVYCENGAAYIFNMSLLYQLTGDQDYLKAARKWLLAFGTYPADLKGNFCIGAYALAVASGYDILYHELAQDERDHLSRHLAAIVKRGIQGTRTDWWAGIAINHDHWLPVAGLGVGAAALFHENPEAPGWLTFLSGIIKHNMNIAGNDGAWAEGTANRIYAMSMTYIFFDAYKRLSNEDLFQSPMAKNAISYRIYNWLMKDTYIYHHDSFVNGRYNVMGAVSGHLMFKLAREHKNVQAQWIAMQEEELDMTYLKENRTVKNDWHISKSSLVPALHSVGWNFLWYDATIRPSPPDDLPKYHFFTNQGLIIMRSGWSPDDVVFAFTCSPVGGHKARETVLSGNKRLLSNYGHTHAQANSFDLFAYGNYLAVPPSYGRLESNYHNTLTIRGAIQERKPQNEANLIKAELKDDYCYIVGDATGCYPDSIGLKRWYRHVAFFQPDIFMLVDEVKTNIATSQINPTRWHLNYLPEASAVIDSAGQEINIYNNSRLYTKILYPSGLKYEKKRISWAANQLNAVINEIPGMGTQNQIVAMLAPLKDSTAAPPVSRLIRAKNMIGAVVDSNDGSKAAIFCLDTGNALDIKNRKIEIYAIKNSSCFIFSLQPNTAYNVKVSSSPSKDGLVLYKIRLKKGKKYTSNEEGTLAITLG